MNGPLQAILFDMGGTLRNSSAPNSSDMKVAKVRRIMEMIGADRSVEDFTATLSRRGKAYLDWARQTRIELSEQELWTQWMLPDWPADRIANLAVQLNQLWRESTGTRKVFPEARAVVLELFRRGYHLGIVSNTTSSTEVPALLEELEISGCFETVLLSTLVGRRKPDPAILLEAAGRMGVAPEACAYVGDRIDRDVAAARAAGFSKAVIMRNPRHPDEVGSSAQDLIPDHSIINLRELLDIFPPRSRPKPGTEYGASLSTMWAIKTFPGLTDFFEFARRTGFTQIELNHKVTSAMLEGMDLKRYRFSSVHEPCPADVSADELKRRDWLVSSTNEECRRAGVRAIQRSIDLAAQLEVPAVVIHAGHASPDHGLEKKLRALIADGRRESDEYGAIQRQMMQARAGAGPCFEAVKSSITELLSYAEGRRVRLGIENRYHYLEFPSPDELEILLALAGPERIGFIYDVGHAQTLDLLGFYPHQEWLERFAPRIIGTHLHDVIGTTDHYVPGLGVVDFERIAAYLPEQAFRTCEFQTFNSPEQVKAGLRFLQECGCIKSPS